MNFNAIYKLLAVLILLLLAQRAQAQDDLEPPPVSSPASQKAPRPADGRLQSALRAYAAGEYTRAESDLRAGIELEPERADLHLRLGIILYKLQRWGDAVASLEKSLSIDGSTVGSLQVIGHCYYELGKLDEALNWYNKVIDKNPAAREAWRGKGITLEKLGRYDEAEDALRKAVNMNPKSASAHLWLARVLIKKKEPGSAMPWLEQAKRVDPFDWEVEFELSRAQMALGNTSAAKISKERSDFLRGHREVINNLKKKLLANPSDTSVIIQLGSQFDIIGDAVRAKGAWDRARQITRDDPAVTVAHSASLFRTGDPRAAEELLRIRLKERPNDAGLWEALWFVTKERGDAKGAAEASSRVKQLLNREASAANLPVFTTPAESRPASAPAGDQK